jgi:hypothetical protein
MKECKGIVASFRLQPFQVDAEFVCSGQKEKGEYEGEKELG